MQPFFAPVASLLPQTVMADFTHQLLDRDYLFQTYIRGTPWSDLHDRLTTEQQTALYRQLGTITRQIHAVTGQAFGAGGGSFRTWSEAIINALERVVAMLEQYQLDSGDVRAVLAIAQTHAHILDAITQPHLLHGDLIRLSLSPPAESASFWDTYGPLDPSADAQFRTRIYQARSLGVSLVETLRLQQIEGHTWVRGKLHEITARLRTMYG